MKNSNKGINKLSAFTYLLVIFIGSIGILFLCFWLGVKKPYIDFKQKEQDVIPQLDELNLALTQQLPSLPPETFFLDRSNRGSTASSHGRWLYINAKTALTMDQIQRYYRTFFLDNGWTINQNYDDTYYRETSCVEIRFLDLSPLEFSIVIWHDFKKQSFTPKEPNVLSLSFYEYGETVFAECP